jgi:putative endonuclease
MAEHNDLGRNGELRAQQYLREKGYLIRHVNYKVGKLELDIVAEKDGWLVIVEVRTRSTATFIAPEETINLTKIRHLVNAASGYIKFFGWRGETRFDIIGIIPNGHDFDIEHIEDAFLPPVN